MQDDDHVAAVQQRYRALLKESADPHDWAYAWRAELSRGGFKTVDFLMREVVDTGKCVGCAACVTICPTDVFDYEDERPVDARAGACVHCVLCADVCPVLRPTDVSLSGALQYREPRLDDGYGPYAYETLARSTRPEIVAHTQDGGVVSTMLMHALDRGAISGAVLGDVDPSDPQVGRQLLAQTAEEILACSGSRYTYSPNTLALVEAMKNGVRPIAVVGVPCQIEGLRQQQHSGIRLEVSRWYQNNVALVIGLFCSESFTHYSLDALSERFEVDRHEIENINIKGKVVIRMRGGRTETMSLKRFRRYARPACLYCQDYSAEHADVAVGGLGLDDWSYVVVRTEAGHRAFQLALEDRWIETRPVEDAPKSKPLLEKLSRAKRARQLPALMPTVSEREESGDLAPQGDSATSLASTERGSSR